MSPVKKVSLYLKKGTSDKVYNVVLEKVRTQPHEAYTVSVAYGRRNKTLRTEVKTKVPHALRHAELIFDNLVTSKKAKGYLEQPFKEQHMPTATTKRTAKPKPADQPTDTEERKTHKISSSKVKVGDLMALIHYVKVKQQGYNQLTVTGLDEGVDQFDVIGTDLIDQMFSADQFAEEVKVNKTKAAEMLVSSFNRPLTVSFAKQDGSERILRGRLVQPEPLLGRSMVEDLDINEKGDARLRQVDHRTINYLIVDGVKYTVK